jgi:hypothetical protein
MNNGLIPGMLPESDSANFVDEFFLIQNHEVACLQGPLKRPPIVACRNDASATSKKNILQGHRCSIDQEKQAMN